jgi:hypothetical protein
VRTLEKLTFTSSAKLLRKLARDQALYLKLLPSNISALSTQYALVLLRMDDTMASTTVVNSGLVDAATTLYFTKDDRSTLSFLDLSAEIRNSIYELVFEHDDPVYVAVPGTDKAPVLHRRLGDGNDSLVNPRECLSVSWLPALTF